MTERSALVTGGSRGIGLGIAERLLTDGYQVVINGVREHEAVAETLEALARLGDITYVAADIGTASGRSHLVAETLAAVGRLGVLINNAGITSPGRRDILEATEEDLDTVLAVNLKGPFLLTQSFASHMVECREADPSFRGRLVNITSISAVLASPNRSEYCISKAGLSMTTKLWATRLAEYGIDVFEVRPGVIQTDMTAPVQEKYEAQIADGLTLERRFGQPEDVAAVVAALAEGDIPYSTGQILTVDGGLTVDRL
ncbi:MAG: 3-ketoacyl-ACP reductase [Acidimicrobiia bacterium]